VTPTFTFGSDTAIAYQCHGKDASSAVDADPRTCAGVAVEGSVGEYAAQRASDRGSEALRDAPILGCKPFGGFPPTGRALMHDDLNVDSKRVNFARGRGRIKSPTHFLGNGCCPNQSDKDLVAEERAGKLKVLALSWHDHGCGRPVASRRTELLEELGLDGSARRRRALVCRRRICKISEG
jgi:hypothetical protein